MDLSFQAFCEKFTAYAPDRKQRRAVVLQGMRERFESGKNCAQCQGFCCTASYNSMQITPAEALDLYLYLKDQNRLNEELVEDLKGVIVKYRLDYIISTGRNSSFRRSYTCPFYKPGAKGCTIQPESKPYGCLAFNPLKEGVRTEGHCASDLNLLEKRESPQEDQLNQKLKEELNLVWEKESIPVALLNLIDIFEQKSRIP